MNEMKVPVNHPPNAQARRSSSAQHRAAAEALLLCRKKCGVSSSKVGGGGGIGGGSGGGRTPRLRIPSIKKVGGVGVGVGVGVGSKSRRRSSTATKGKDEGDEKLCSAVRCRASVRDLVARRKWKKLGALLELDEEGRREALAFEDEEDFRRQESRGHEDGGCERTVRRLSVSQDDDGGIDNDNDTTGHGNVVVDNDDDDDDENENRGGNVLHLALRLSAPPLVLRGLVSARPSLAAGIDSDGRTPLHVACSARDPPRRRPDPQPAAASMESVLAIEDGVVGAAAETVDARRSSSVLSSSGGRRGSDSGLRGSVGTATSASVSASTYVAASPSRRSTVSSPLSFSLTSASTATGATSSSRRRSALGLSLSSLGAVGGHRHSLTKKHQQQQRQQKPKRRKLSSLALRILCDAHPPSLLVEDLRGSAPVDLAFECRDEENRRNGRSSITSETGTPILPPGELRRRTDADVAVELLVRRTERVWTTRARRAARRTSVMSSASSVSSCEGNGDDNEDGDGDDDAQEPTTTATTTTPTTTPADACRAVELRRRRWTARRTHRAAGATLDQYRTRDDGPDATTLLERGSSGPSTHSHGGGGGGGDEPQLPRVRVGLRASSDERFDDGMFFREDALRMFLGDDWYDDEMGEERTCVESDSEDEERDDDDYDDWYYGEDGDEEDCKEEEGQDESREEEEDEEVVEQEGGAEEAEEAEEASLGCDERRDEGEGRVVAHDSTWNVEPPQLLRADNGGGGGGRATVGIPPIISILSDGSA